VSEDSSTRILIPSSISLDSNVDVVKDDAERSTTDQRDTTSSPNHVAASRPEAADATPTLTEQQKKKDLAPIPKVNVWSVRQQQLAQAAEVYTPTASSSESTHSSHVSSADPAAAVGAADSKSPLQATNRSTTKANSKATKAAAAAEKDVSAKPDAKIANNNIAVDPDLAPSVSSSTQPPAPKRKAVEGWSKVPSKSAVASTALPVLGGDVESWPSPNEEPAATAIEKTSKKGKGSSAKASSNTNARGSVPGEAQASAGKKKGQFTRRNSG
jgi:hypothetical protein